MSVQLVAASSQSLTVPTINSVKSISFMCKPTANNEWLADIASGLSIVNGCVPIGFSGAATVYVNGVAITQLGSELVTNGNMELTTSWPSGSSAPATNERSAEQAHGGTYSRKIVVNTGDYRAAYQSITVVSGKRHFLSFWEYTSSGVGAVVQFLEITPSTNWIWKTANTSGAWGYFYAVGTTTDTDGRVTLYSNNGNTTFYVDDVSLKPIQTPLTAGSWNHVVITSDTAFNVSAGTVGKVGSNYGNFFISDLAFWNASFSAAQALTMYNGGVPLCARIPFGLRDNLLGYYRLDSGDGLIDRMGRLVGLIAVNSPAYSTDMPDTVSYEQQVFAD